MDNSGPFLLVKTNSHESKYEKWPIFLMHVLAGKFYDSFSKRKIFFESCEKQENHEFACWTWPFLAIFFKNREKYYVYFCCWYKERDVLTALYIHIISQIWSFCKSNLIQISKKQASIPAMAWKIQAILYPVFLKKKQDINRQIVEPKAVLVPTS